MRAIIQARLLPFVALLFAIGCASTAPTPPPPPPIEDPPKIICPVLSPIQLTTGTSIAATYATPAPVNGKAPVTVSCVPPSGSAFAVGTTGVTCTATDALQRTATCTFPVTVLAVPPPPTLADTRFFAFGDSITRGEDGNNASTSSSLSFYPRVILPPAQTYPGVLTASLIARYTTQSPIVTNQGLPSEGVTDAGTLGRFTTFSSNRQYDAALIMEGTNDVYKARNGTGNPNLVLDAAAAGLRSMIGDAKSRNILPFLATIPPINPSGFRGMVYGAELVPGFNDRIRSLAASENVPLVDIYQAFGGNLTLLGADGVHPTPKGYRKIAGTFFDAIQGALEVKTSSATAVRRLR
jgi:lysophospholipase L1-like esterase